MENIQINAMKAHYVFYSNETGNTYILNLRTQNLGPIKTLDNPNCIGYSIIQGTLTKVATDGTSNNYTIPGGQTHFIYNGLWPNAAQSPNGLGSPLCQGIDQLFGNFNPSSSNTQIFANDSNNITVEFDQKNTDTAVLLHAIFPPI